MCSGWNGLSGTPCKALRALLVEFEISNLNLQFCVSLNKRDCESAMRSHVGDSSVSYFLLPELFRSLYLKVSRTIDKTITIYL